MLYAVGTAVANTRLLLVLQACRAELVGQANGSKVLSDARVAVKLELTPHSAVLVETLEVSPTTTCTYITSAFMT
jgi:hypothetical protein